MDLGELRKKARENLMPYCRVCPVCDGRVCAGEVPGMGGTGTGTGFRANIEALARRRFNLKTLHGVRQVETTMTLWGQTLTMPVIAAPTTGVSYNMGGRMTEEAFVEAWVRGALQEGTLAMTGDGADPVMYDSGLRAIRDVGGQGIPIIKPRSQEEIIRRIRQAEEAGAPAVGMDVDGAGLITMALKGQPVGPKTPAELREIIAATPLPFIVKGIMTPSEAAIAADCGAAALVVSNHGGRVLDFTPGTAEVLPGIAEQVRGRLTILVDGGVRSGADVLKLLALGADAVLVGRPLIIGALGNGQDGVAQLLRKMQGELAAAMLLTGTADVRHVACDILA
ncbi:MAG: alpha-hydroxy-acid oxidizing enzyme [Desulfobulbaceae bacterium A2]|nr:MAG: alpha-hydroxy-acid oxidizing enzyme [Desulfobulbaceae bacterium A2]